MDLLSQYKQEHPPFQKQKPQAVTDPYGREYGAMVRLVMRLSGGRIRDARQANYALATFAGIIFLISLFFFFRFFRSSQSLPSAQEILRDTPTSGLRPGALMPQ
ncbi:MAG: hypothetical protein HYT41_01010 [Candidatus Sungbacteria bacterium]|nr:hypothetical protein [Candidatus Sungbacteria bacterium]